MRNPFAADRDQRACRVDRQGHSRNVLPHGEERRRDRRADCRRHSFGKTYGAGDPSLIGLEPEVPPSRIRASAGRAAKPQCELSEILLASVCHPNAAGCTNGRFFDRASEKLSQLARFDSNELVSGDLQSMAAALSSDC
jgi:hypothetical protein